MNIQKLTIIVTAFVTLSIFWVSCSKKRDSAIIPTANLFPQPSVFGDDCTVNRAASDKVALEILDGSFAESPEKNSRDMAYTQCAYQKPNVVVSISRFTTAEKCEVEYKKGYEAFKKSNDVTPLSGHDVEGYRYKIGSKPGCCFRYGNVAVMFYFHDEDEEDRIIEALIKHFESI